MNFCAFYTTILARRSTARNGTTQNDTFGYNARSELTSATLGSDNYAYAFDNIGNRNSATETGTWQITYNGANRPVRFRNEESDTTIDCGYDSQGRRYFKKVTVSGTVTLHHRYIYRGYFQIAAVDMTRSGQPDLWLTTWDPSQATATRPLAIQKDGTWFTYGYDLTKNICEVFGPAGYIRTAYSYAPFGAVTASDNSVVQPFQWSSEHYDSELDLVYYSYRHYSPSLGRFLSRDPIEEQGGLNLYAFVENNPVHKWDRLGCAIPQLGAGPDAGILSSTRNCAERIVAFEKWIENEKKDLSWIDKLPRCPTKLSCRWAYRMITVVVNTGFVCSFQKKIFECSSPNPDLWTLTMNIIFKCFSESGHPGGKYELRTVPKPEYKGTGNQCIYDGNGYLVSTHPTAGTVDKCSPDGKGIIGCILGHRKEDVLPFKEAKALDEDCGGNGFYEQLYYTVRPTR